MQKVSDIFFFKKVCSVAAIDSNLTFDISVLDISLLWNLEKSLWESWMPVLYSSVWFIHESTDSLTSLPMSLHDEQHLLWRVRWAVGQVQTETSVITSVSGYKIKEKC